MWDSTKPSHKNFPPWVPISQSNCTGPTDLARAKRFYLEILQLEEDQATTDEVGYRIGESVLIVRQYPPTADPNPRITLQVRDARKTQKQLTERAVTISDPVQLYKGKFWLGAFLDSEGNKFWFCSHA